MRKREMLAALVIVCTVLVAGTPIMAETTSPKPLTPQQQKEARRRRAEGATLKELAKSYNVGRATISRLAG